MYRLSTAVAMWLAACYSASGASWVMNQIQSSALVVIGETAGMTVAPNGAVSLNVRVIRELKGTDHGTSLSVELRAPARAVAGFRWESAECGLFFLAPNAEGWTALPPADLSLSLQDFYYPSDACASGGLGLPANPGPDDFVELILHSLWVGPPSDRAVLALSRGLWASDSPVVLAAAAELSTSPQPGLQALGLMWRIAQGEDRALAQVPALVPKLKQSSLGSVLVGPISAYARVSDAAAKSLGEIASQGTGSGFERAAAQALRALHTRAAVPYLLALLDSADQGVRLDAVGGLSMVLAGVPPLSGRSPQGTFEKAMNPASRKRLSADDEAHVFFAGTDFAKREAELVSWWKARAQTMMAGNFQ